MQVQPPPQSNTLRDIDHLLTQLDSKYSAHDEGLVSQLWARMCEHLMLGADSKDLERVVLGTTYSSTQAKLVSAVLLRLLATDHTAVSRVRLKAVNLIESHNEELMRRLKIGPRDQTHEKVQKLRDVKARAESALAQIVETFRYLDQVRNLRHDLMKQLGQVENQAVIEPFLPGHILKADLPAALEKLVSYLDDSSPGAYRLYEEATGLLASIEKSADTFGTHYSRRYLGDLARSIRRLLDEHLKNSPFGKPAQVIVKPTDKRYPLQQPGRRFDLVFSVVNVGSGFASGVSIEVKDITDLKPSVDQLYVGTIEPHATHLVRLQVEVNSPVQSYAVIELNVTWSNVDGTGGSSSEAIELLAQHAGIDWDNLEQLEPYSTEPVTSDDELVGRSEILRSLVARVRARSMGSSFIIGQKRVGKTSIARALSTRLKTLEPNLLVVYLESGDYIMHDASTTIESLGKRIHREVTRSDKRFQHIPCPDFKGAFSNLEDLLLALQDVDPQTRLLIVLDEFDELPPELYKVGAVGDAFFLTVRSMSGKGSCGFVLVGGEKMTYVIDHQGSKLNKFEKYEVDYFNRESQWADFQALVRRPVEGKLEITDSALEALYSYTAGNPYFTKLICREMFANAVSARDAYVTDQEISAAVRAALLDMGSTSFQHFWDDGIVEGQRRESKAAQRKKVLLALADVLRRKTPAPVGEILKSAENNGMNELTVQRELQEFEQRQILVSSPEGYRCKVRLFEEWLKDRGSTQILTTFNDLDAALEQRRAEEKLRVGAAELMELIKRWGPTYKGQPISADHVRAWLDQFETAEEQRLMFELLQGLRFYHDGFVREKMAEAYDVLVRAHGSLRLAAGTRKKREILVSHLGDVAKSGTYYARLFADENNIYTTSNAVEFSRIGQSIEEMPQVQILTFVDDFVGSGDSAIEQLAKLEREFGAALRERNILVGYIAISGLAEGYERLVKYAESLDLRVSIHVFDLLTDSERCFSKSSRIFPDPSRREQAYEVAHRYGARLDKASPLGYKNSQALVVFSQNCPNNTLPIINRRTKDWIPLFER